MTAKLGHDRVPLGIRDPKVRPLARNVIHWLRIPHP
jgi:hypothetical protein